MNAKDTVRYLNGLKAYLTEMNEKEEDKSLKPFIEALEDTIRAVQPPIGKVQKERLLDT